MDRTDSITAPVTRGSDRTRRGVLRLLSERGPLSRAALARELAVAPTTASNAVAALIAAGVVEEVSDGTTPHSSGRGRGRPGRRVSLSGGRGTVAGIDVGRTHLLVVVGGRDGRVLAEREVPLPLGHHGTDTVDLALDTLGALLEETADHGRLVSIGVGLPGPLERRTNTVGAGTILPEWVGFDIVGRLRDRLGVPVNVDNDANLGMLAEARWGAARGVTDAAYVKISTGIGSGLLLGGRLHRGAGGTAGEVGHSPVDPDGVVCRCGNRGCLETVAAVPALLAALRPTFGPDITLERVLTAARDGDVAARRMVEDVGHSIGRGIGLLCNIVDPELVLLGGPLVAAGTPFFDAVRSALRRAAIPSAWPRVRVDAAALGDRTIALGALALALEHAPDLSGAAA